MLLKFCMQRIRKLDFCSLWMRQRRDIDFLRPCTHILKQLEQAIIRWGPGPGLANPVEEALSTKATVSGHFYDATFAASLVEGAKDGK